MKKLFIVAGLLASAAVVTAKPDQNALESGLFSINVNDTANKFWVTKQIVGPTFGAVNLISDDLTVFNQWKWGTAEGQYTPSIVNVDGVNALQVRFINKLPNGGLSNYSDFSLKWFSFLHPAPLNPFGYKIESNNYVATPTVDTMYSAVVDMEKNPVVRMIAKSDKKVNVRLDVIDANGRVANTLAPHHWLQGNNELDTLEFRWNYKSYTSDGSINYHYENPETDEFDVAAASDGWSDSFLDVRQGRNSDSLFFHNRFGYPGAVLLDLAKIVGIAITFDDGSIGQDSQDVGTQKTVIIKQITVGGNGSPVNISNYITPKQIKIADTAAMIRFSVDKRSYRKFDSQTLSEIVMTSHVNEVGYKVLDTKIATVENGVLTATGVGSTSVIAYSKTRVSIADTLQITVADNKDFSFSFPRMVIFENDTIDVTACVKVTNEIAIRYKIADETYAFVTANNKLIGKQYGNTKVFAINTANEIQRDSMNILVLPNIVIVGVKVSGDNKTLEVYMDKDVPLYSGIENDFVVSSESRVKSSISYSVVKIVKSNDNPKVILLQLDKAVASDQVLTINYAPQGAMLSGSDVRSTFSVAATTTTEEIADDAAKVFPNPVNDVLSVSATDLQAVELYNAEGEVICSTNVQKNITTIDVSNLAQGMYVVNLITSKRSIKKTIIKK